MPLIQKHAMMDYEIGSEEKDMIRLIGDVHGHFDRYNHIVRDVKDTIQVGDMGVGFRYRHRDGEIRYSSNPSHYMMKRDNHRFIRGNHDNPEYCQNNSQWIPDGTVENDVMFIGGANSIDKGSRTEDFDWWRDEELSIQRLNGLISEYDVVRPRVMITHDCPDSIANLLFGEEIINGIRALRWNDNSRTRQAFDTMFSIHQPKLWCHGHWHQSRDQIINGTRFICLAELETIDIDFNEI